MSRRFCFKKWAVQLLLLPQAAWSSNPRVSDARATIDGEFISVTSWHARSLTNISWDIPTSRQHAHHVIAFSWDEDATMDWLFDSDNNSSRADSPPSFTSTTSYYLPVEDESVSGACNFRSDAFNSSSEDAFYTDVNEALVSVDLTDGVTWWYTASFNQDMPASASNTSGVGKATVMLTKPGFYTACLLLPTEPCIVEDCINITVYQPPYDFLEVDSTNVGNTLTVRFNLASRDAYSGDWMWILGGVDPSFTIEDANALTASETIEIFDERCWFYVGRAIELGSLFLCSPDPDPILASCQSTPTALAYQYGRFELHISTAGNESVWFAKREQYFFAMLTNFYTCGITVQPLNSTTVSATSDLVVKAVPEHGETCGVGDGITLQVRTGEVPAVIDGVVAWIYFTGWAVNISYEETSLYVRIPYQGVHFVVVSLESGAALDTMEVTSVAADPYAPACEVVVPTPGISPIGSSVSVSFTVRDFYGNNISEPWGNDAFKAWCFNPVDNETVASVHEEEGGGSYQVVTSPLDVSGATFLFVERNGLGLPGSPFQVYVFGPDTCTSVSSVGYCQSNLQRPVVLEWAVNSPCRGIFDNPEHRTIPCDFVPVRSGLGNIMIASSVFSGLYAAGFLLWLRRNRQTTTVKLSQPFVCQLFLVGCILLSITTAFYVGEASQVACLLRPWILHVALTFTSSCLYMKTYRVHRIFNNKTQMTRMSISDRQLVKWVLQFVAVDVLLLLVWTVLDRPRKVDHTTTVEGFVAINSVCTGNLGFPIYSVILWSWKACLNLFGAVIAAKTWHCEDGVGESQPICLSVYNTTLLGFVNLAIQLLMADQVAIKVGTRTFTSVGGTVFIVSVIFAPKAYYLWRYGDLSPNTAERRASSASIAGGRRHSSLTGGRLDTTGGIGRRKSSLGSGLDFTKIGRVAPITENPSVEEAAIARSHQSNDFNSAPG